MWFLWVLSCSVKLTSFQATAGYRQQHQFPQLTPSSLTEGPGWPDPSLPSLCFPLCVSGEWGRDMCVHVCVCEGRGVA
jgi:hypothetical protein